MLESWIAREKRNYEESDMLLSKSDILYEKEKNKYGIHRVKINKMILNVCSNDMENAYQIMKSIERNSGSILFETNDKLFFIYRIIIHIKMKNNDEAYNLYNLYKSDYRQYGNIWQNLALHYAMSRMYVETGKFKEANNFVSTYSRIFKIIYSTCSDKRMQILCINKYYKMIDDAISFYQEHGSNENEATLKWLTLALNR